MAGDGSPSYLPEGEKAEVAEGEQQSSLHHLWGRQESEARMRVGPVAAVQPWLQRAGGGGAHLFCCGVRMVQDAGPRRGRGHGSGQGLGMTVSAPITAPSLGSSDPRMPLHSVPLPNFLPWTPPGEGRGQGPGTHLEVTEAERAGRCGQASGCRSVSGRARLVPGILRTG